MVHIRRKKVGIFTWDFEPIEGGMGVQALELYNALLHDSEFEPVVFSPRKNSLLNHFQLRKISSGKVGQLLFSFQCAFQLESLIKKHSLDIVHFIGSSGGVQLLKKPSVPCVFTLNNTYFYLARKFNSSIFRFMRFLEKISLKNADKKTAISEGIVSEINTVQNEDISVVYMGIDAEIFKPLSIKQERIILYVGRLVERKGVFDLLHAFAKLKNNGFSLLFIGDGSAKQELIQTAQNLSVDKNVKIISKIDRAQLPEFYSKAALVVLPSWSEGFGLTIAEAMACGAVVLGSDIVGIRDQINDSENGFLFEVQNQADLAEKIDHILLLGSVAEKIRKAAIEKAAIFSSQKMLADYKKLYTGLLR
ncbi:MAG: glycosyltransferase family 4 protein [Candidatus Diapherotrites archaeon]|nr:glycosyltransferase family 4 protein [Candidatus Diapherotrites archaeon]